jgi:hypothetical protein
MIIASALYYAGSLANPASLVRDNRFYPAKAVQTFGVWWQYLRRHYPDVPVVLFADTASPIPIRPLLNTLPEPWWDVDERHLPCSEDMVPQVMVKWLSAHSGKYFWPMQRNLVEAICWAYRANKSLLWIDADAFLNTDIRPLLRGCDCAASGIQPHQMTMDSVCFYLSARRLHALDGLVDLPSFLTTMLNEGPTETRMHTLQEGGLYKLFAYGDVRALGRDIQLAHLSCYDRFLTFLRRNPLDTPEYRALVTALKGVDWTTLPSVERAFWDMLYPDNAV